MEVHVWDGTPIGYSMKMTAERHKVDTQLEIQRHEAKYVIPRALVSEIREFIRPFVVPDKNGRGDPPEYIVTTLQMDSPGLLLHHAKEDELINRFKLRVRTYGVPTGNCPVFAEVKRKFRGTISKSRSVIPYEAWSEDLVKKPYLPIRFATPKQELAFLEFRRLTYEIGAEPVVLIRYTRESYAGKYDHYSRVTFDRNLLYQPTRSWTGFGGDGKWFSADTPSAQAQELPFSGVVLELKTMMDAPHWIIDLIMEFNLVRYGNCKYSTAIYQESLFRGSPAMPVYGGKMFMH